MCHFRRFNRGLYALFEKIQQQHTLGFILKLQPNNDNNFMTLRHENVIKRLNLGLLVFKL